MFAKRLGQAALSLCLLAPFTSQATPSYSALYVFGDSLSDGGSDFALSSAIHSQINAFPITPGAPADFQGRFSNGPVAVDYLATRLGLPLTAHYLTPPFLGGLVGGNNYAQGGATSGLENASLPATLGPNVTGFKGMTAEVNDYKAAHAVADPNAVYIVWAGANDFLTPNSTAILPSCMVGSVIAQQICTGVTNIANAAAALAAIGAQHIIVPNLPDLGKTARSIAAGPATQAAAHALSVAFNSALVSALNNVATVFPGDVVPFDLFSLFDEILANASANGFTDTTHACLTGSSADPTSVIGPACAAVGPNSFVFWDDIHPTTHTQALLGQRFAAALGLPEPSELALLGLGLIALVALRGRRRAH